ncbi:MAG: nuclear transport factor 2 family protein [Acidobacteriaceae bacterium]
MKRLFILPAISMLLGGIFFATGVPTHAQATQSDAATQEQVDIQKVVDRWDDAANQHDQYALELVLAPQFIAISDTGQVKNRDQQVTEMVIKGAPRFTLSQKVVSVRVLGDVAVVNGTYDRVYQASRLGHTPMRDMKGVFSQVYIRARSSWQCVNSQRTLIVAPTLKNKKTKKDASQEKTLTHGLGFNFPGLHRTTSPDAQPPQ